MHVTQKMKSGRICTFLTVGYCSLCSSRELCIKEWCYYFILFVSKGKCALEKQFPEAAPGQPRFRVPIGSYWVFLFAFSSCHGWFWISVTLFIPHRGESISTVYLLGKEMLVLKRYPCVCIFTSYLLDVFVPAIGF